MRNMFQSGRQGRKGRDCFKLQKPDRRMIFGSKVGYKVDTYLILAQLVSFKGYLLDNKLLLAK